MFSKETYVKRRELLRERVSRGGLIRVAGQQRGSEKLSRQRLPFPSGQQFPLLLRSQTARPVGLLDIDAGEDWLFGDDLSMDDIIWTGPQPTVSELGARCGISHTAPLAVLQEKLTLAIRKGVRCTSCRPTVPTTN